MNLCTSNFVAFFCRKRFVPTKGGRSQHYKKDFQNEYFTTQRATEKRM